MFPSHNGSDQTQYSCDDKGQFYMFPSHNGSDQTQSVDEAIELYLKFPSHNGSDQTDKLAHEIFGLLEVSIPQWFGSNNMCIQAIQLWW